MCGIVDTRLGLELGYGLSDEVEMPIEPRPAPALKPELACMGDEGHDDSEPDDVARTLAAARPIDAPRPVCASMSGDCGLSSNDCVADEVETAFGESAPKESTESSAQIEALRPLALPFMLALAFAFEAAPCCSAIAKSCSAGKAPDVSSADRSSSVGFKRCGCW